jgi:hypothetical protein
MWRCALGLAVAVCGCGDSDAQIRAVDPPPCAASGTWDPAFVLPGFGGEFTEINAAIRAPDGRVVVAGSFDHVLGGPMRSAAAWDGSTWSALGDGEPGDVNALAYDAEGVLWAAGDVTRWAEGGERLVRWDGSTWTTVAEAQVTTLIRFDGGLAVGGAFTSIGGVEAHGLAVWDGASWSSLDLDAGSIVRTAAAIPGGVCIAGRIAAFSDGIDLRDGAACWDGIAWAALGDPLRGISTMGRAPDGRWWVGGTFSEYIDGVEVGGVARLDGAAWQVVDGGVQDGGFFPMVDVQALLFEGDAVLVGGKFIAAGPERLEAWGLARWSLTDGWTPVRHAAGFVGGGLGEGDWLGVHALLPDGDGVLVAGRFASLGETFAPNLARLGVAFDVEPMTGARVALGGAARPLTQWGGDLIAAHVSAGETVRAPVGLFDGAWHPIAGDPPVVDVSRALAHADGGLTIVSDVVLHWDGAQWIQLAAASARAWPALIDSEDSLYVALDGVRIERWRGDAREPLGALDFWVTAITTHAGELVVAGFVPTEDGSGPPRMAIRRDGAWHPIDVPLAEGLVDAHASPSLGVVVRTLGGQVAAWDGVTWSELGSGGATALAVCDTGIYAAFYEGPSSTLQLHDGTAWRILDPGQPGLTTDLVPTGSELWVGSDTTGDSGIARWSFSP